MTIKKKKNIPSRDKYHYDHCLLSETLPNSASITYNCLSFFYYLSNWHLWGFLFLCPSCKCYSPPEFHPWVYFSYLSRWPLWLIKHVAYKMYNPPSWTSVPCLMHVSTCSLGTSTCVYTDSNLSPYLHSLSQWLAPPLTQVNQTWNLDIYPSPWRPSDHQETSILHYYYPSDLSSPQNHHYVLRTGPCFSSSAP